MQTFTSGLLRKAQKNFGREFKVLSVEYLNTVGGRGSKPIFLNIILTLCFSDSVFCQYIYIYVCIYIYIPRQSLIVYWLMDAELIGIFFMIPYFKIEILAKCCSWTTLCSKGLKPYFCTEKYKWYVILDWKTDWLLLINLSIHSLIKSIFRLNVIFVPCMRNKMH